MLTDERYNIILSLLEKQHVAKLAELVQATGASESTIRRDLSVLEDEKKLKRIHGGASLLNSKSNEPTMIEKKNRFADEKHQIGQTAASFIENGDCIFVDAGTTTEAMIPFIGTKDVIIVTNGSNIIQESLRHGFQTYVTGGYVKSGTNAFVGKLAVEALSQFRFDKSFIGANGVDIAFGYSTPDPEEAQVKKMAISQSSKAFILADGSKFHETSFAKFAEIRAAKLITTGGDASFIEQIMQSTEVEVAIEQ